MLYDLLRPNPDRTWRQRLKSFVRKTLLVLESAAVAAVLTGVWYVCWRNGWHLPANAEVRISTIILVELGLLGFIAAVTTIKVVDRSAELSRFVRSNDETGFMTIRDIRIPIRLHLIFAALGFSMLTLIYSLGYESVWEGLFATYFPTFSIVMYFSVVMELQDPHRSTWFKSIAPEQWLTQDADEYFNELARPKQRKHTS